MREKLRNGTIWVELFGRRPDKKLGVKYAHNLKNCLHHRTGGENKMNDNTKKTIAGMFMVVPGIYLAEELILGHPSEPHVAESLNDTSTIMFTMSTVSGTTTSTGPVNFVNGTNFYTYNQTT